MNEKNIYNWEQKEAALVASRVTENWSLATPTKPPSPTALEVVILTTPSAGNDDYDFETDFVVYHDTVVPMDICRIYIGHYDGLLDCINWQVMIAWDIRLSGQERKQMDLVMASKQ